MALNLGWINRLVATRSAVRSASEEIERVAVRGLPSPGSSAPPMTPLTAEQWAPIRDGLAQIAEEVENLIQSVAPKEAADEHRIQPFAATRYQLSVALLMLEEQVIDDLDPARVHGFGEVNDIDSQQLTNSVTRMRQQVRSLLNYVETMQI